jgi:hypothetical protein
VTASKYTSSIFHASSAQLPTLFPFACNTATISEQPNSQREARLRRRTQRQLPIQTGIPTPRAGRMTNQLTAADVQALITAAIAPIQQELTDAQAEVLRLQGQILQQAAAAQQQAAPAQTPFARTPATATTTMIDYRSKIGLEVFRMGSEKLKSEFDLSSTKQPQFMEEIDRRSVKQGWKSTILNINGVYFIRSYGTFTYDMVLTHVCLYAFQSDREEQDATSLQICLEDTLSSSALATINAERSRYTLTRAQVNAQRATAQLPQIQGNANDEYQDGVLFLWCILNRTAPQTNVTISTIIRQLMRLNNIMEEGKYDILAFNTKVRLLLNQYVANTGHEYDRAILLNGLFEAYKLPTNQEFLNFIVRVEQDHNFNITMMTSDLLMESALKLYQTKTVDGSWDQLSSEQKQAINLMAQINSFKAKLTPSRVQGEKSERQGNKTQEERMRKKYEEAPSWKKKKPEDINAPHIEDGRTYYWCTKHQMYTMHKAVDCKLPKCNNFYRANGITSDNSKEGGKKEASKGNKEASKEDSKLQYTRVHANLSMVEYEDY